MNGIIASFFGPFSQIELTGTGAMFGFGPELEVGLGAGSDAFAQKFSEFRGVFRFLKRIALVGFGDFGIALSLGDTAHGKIHTYFGTLAVKVHAKVRQDVLFYTLGNTDYMLRSPALAVSLFNKFGSRGFALGTAFRGGVSGMNITTDGTYKLLHKSSPLSIYHL
jgi:hypothetical protein